MKTLLGKIAFSLSLTTLAFATVSAQSGRLIKEQSSVTISGTSSLHDWHEKAGDFTTAVVFTANDGPASAIEKVTFICKSASVTSDNSIMTDKTQSAIQAKKYPEITFISDKPVSVPTHDGDFSATVTGQLNLKGVTKSLSIPVKGSYAGNTLSISGSHSIKLSDYSISPPTAMLGTLKTGDLVTVHFDLKFQISEN